MIYLRKFDNHAAYEAAESSLVLPNVSLCVNENEVHYNPYVPPTPVETRVVAKFNVTDTSNPTNISYEYEDEDDGTWYNGKSGFSAIEIDGVEQSRVVTAYTFSTTGEHTVKYTLRYPTRIVDYAFFGCRSLTSVVIPDSVTSISERAFQFCSSLTSIDIPDSVTSIGIFAFSSCSGLTSCTIGSGVTSIGASAFGNCSSLTSIVIPSGVTSIGNQAFNFCSAITSCTIGSGVTSIGQIAFGHCSSLTSIVSNVTTAPIIQSDTFTDVKTGGTLTVPSGSSGYDVWMGTGNYYLGKYNWTKVEQ